MFFLHIFNPAPKNNSVNNYVLGSMFNPDLAIIHDSRVVWCLACSPDGIMRSNFHLGRERF